MDADRSGKHARPYHGPASDDSRIWRSSHENYFNNLTAAKSVKALTNRFVDLFHEEIDVSGRPENTEKNQWTTTTIQDFLRDKMFRAGVRTMFHDDLLDIAGHGFAADYWRYDDNFLKFIYSVPHSMFQRGCAARDRLLASINSYMARARTHYDSPDRKESTEDYDFDAGFGSRLVRRRTEALSKHGISQEGQASNILGLIFGFVHPLSSE